MNKRRLIIIANGLRHKSGHHYMEARSFREETEKMGMEVVILSHEQVEPSIRDELKAHPCFERSPYWRNSASNRFFWWLEFRRSLKTFLARLAAAPIHPISPNDVIVSTLTKGRDILALAYWVKSLPKQERPQLALNFMIDDFSQSIGGQGAWKIRESTAKFYRKAYRKLCRFVDSEKIHLTTGGTEYSKAMSKILGCQVRVSPLPVQLNLNLSDIKSDKPNPLPVLTFLGYMQPGKGGDLIGPTIRKVLASNTECHFVLQANPADFADKWRLEIGEAGMRHVTIQHGEMSQDEYQAIFRSSDIVLLPYRPETYRLRTSGIFAEAMALGKVVVTSPHTWMAEMAQRHGGAIIVAEEFSVDSMVSAILKSLSDFPVMSQQMKEISRYWREEMGMKSFIGEILRSAEKADGTG
jgi:glycosyltransferase involved in cell wall biosynthesis